MMGPNTLWTGQDSTPWRGSENSRDIHNLDANEKGFTLIN
jgi:hypothetical protein